MPLFRYKALTASGEPVQGEMEAPNEQAVVTRLHEAGQIPVNTEQVDVSVSTSGSSLFFGPKRAISSANVTMLTGKLAIMLRAGLPLDNALDMLRNLLPEGDGRQLMDRIRADVQNGAHLSDAMEPHPQIFNKLYVNTLRAGEAAGALDTVLSKLADYLERSRELRETVKSAMIYPAILFGVALLSIAILMIYVVPQFSEMFEGMNQAMPLPMALVIGASNFIKSSWWLILLLMIASVFGIRWMMKNPATRRIIDTQLLKWPLISDLVKKTEVARFSRTLGTLTANGVPLLTGLGIVRETMSNSVMSESIGAVTEQLREGKGMAKPLSETGLFPQLAVQLIHVGEETGELEKMLDQLAEVYDGEVKEAVKRLLTLLEPALIIGLGIIIAGIIISILSGILSLNDFVA